MVFKESQDCFHSKTQHFFGNSWRHLEEVLSCWSLWSQLSFGWKHSIRNCTKKELNELIKQKQDSIEQDDLETVEVLKRKVQELEDEREMALARKQFAKVQLEGEKPSKKICSMNRKRIAKAQFEELHITEKDDKGVERIKVISEQKDIEWEVRKYYWKLYSEHEAKVDREEILRNIDMLPRLEQEDSRRLECEITEDEVSVTLKNTKNNVAPGPGGFGGGVTKFSGII